MGPNASLSHQNTLHCYHQQQKNVFDQFWWSLTMLTKRGKFHEAAVMHYYDQLITQIFCKMCNIPGRLVATIKVEWNVSFTKTTPLTPSHCVQVLLTFPSMGISSTIFSLNFKANEKDQHLNGGTSKSIATAVAKQIQQNALFVAWSCLCLWSWSYEMNTARGFEYHQMWT